MRLGAGRGLEGLQQGFRRLPRSTAQQQALGIFQRLQLSLVAFKGIDKGPLKTVVKLPKEHKGVAMLVVFPGVKEPMAPRFLPVGQGRFKGEAPKGALPFLWGQGLAP